MFICCLCCLRWPLTKAVLLLFTYLLSPRITACWVRSFMINTSHLHAFTADTHSQNLCKTVSLAPVKHIGQHLAILLHTRPPYGLTATALCHESHKSPASFLTRSEFQVFVHFILTLARSIPPHFLVTTSCTTCRSCNRALPIFAEYCINGTSPGHWIYLGPRLGNQFFRSIAV